MVLTTKYNIYIIHRQKNYVMINFDLKRLRNTIINKYSGKLSSSVNFLHDNAGPHVGVKLNISLALT